MSVLTSLLVVIEIHLEDFFNLTLWWYFVQEFSLSVRQKRGCTLAYTSVFLCVDMLQKPISTRSCHKNSTVCSQAQPYCWQMGGDRNTFDRTERNSTILPCLPGVNARAETNCCELKVAKMASPFV